MPAPTKSNPPMSPDGGAAQPAVPKTELQELQMKAGEVTDEVSNFFSFFHIIRPISSSLYNQWWNTSIKGFNGSLYTFEVFMLLYR